jgi:hypothetical protein
MKLRTLLLAAVTPLMFSCGDTHVANTQNANRPAETRDSAFSVNESTANGAGARSTEPRTIRDFFMLLPEKYFTLEGCDRSADPDCRRAKLDYLRSFAEVEDTANGYLKGGCDGGQACLTMALFKRPNGTYLVGVATEHEMSFEHYFLDYADGKWSDVTNQIVPEFSKSHIYELPRVGTTVAVFSTKVVDKGDGFEIRDKAAKLYDLEWKDGKFSIKR